MSDSAANRQELEARTAEAVEFAGQVARQLDGCRERANAGNVEIARLKHALGEIVRLYEVPGTGRRKTAGQVAAAALAGR